VHEGHQVDHPTTIDGKERLPPPFKPGDFDVVIAGFPWYSFPSLFACLTLQIFDSQPHSTLNMFQKADDRKTNLILPVLSFIDFLKVKFVVFENVRGFLSFNLSSVQAGLHRTEGGIVMGGLKLVTASLVKMK
jgi:DNA (cytosine-5)-methyltransferase 1